MDEKHYVGEVGTEVLVDTGTDLTAAKKLQLIVKKPISGTTVIWNGIINGLTKIKYVIKRGDWNEAGIYILQSYVEFSTWSGRGNSVKYQIFPIFE